MQVLGQVLGIHQKKTDKSLPSWNLNSSGRRVDIWVETHRQLGMVSLTPRPTGFRHPLKSVFIFKSDSDIPIF